VQKRKQIAKDLKRPDHFVDFWTHTWQRLAEVLAPRRKPAVAAAVALAVVLVGAAIFNYWDGTRRLAASRALVRVQQIQTAELLPATDDKNDIESDARSDVPRFKTQPERQTAVLKELDTFLSQNGSSGLKAQAQIMRGGVLLAIGRFDDALGAYDAALSARLDARLRFLAHEGQGYAYEGKGDLDKAAAAFAKIAADAGAFQGFYQDASLYHKARLTELKGDKAGAVAIYKQILDKVPDTAMKDQITDRLALLEAK